ncbi:MAG: FFLEELY motif protein [Rhizomicrobium sp.]
MSENDAIAQRIIDRMDQASRLRAAAQSDPKAAAARQSLRTWQAQRLARTHANLLTNPKFAETATFFLTDLYGANDPGARDAEVRRVLPVMVRVLPAAGLETVADALELDALSEDLDTAMVAALGRRVTGLDSAAYGRAYRKVDRRPDRERQIDLIQHLGQSLDSLARRPFVTATLAMMRKPAELAGLGDLQSFLERGYAAFKKMGGADEFLNLVIAREREVLKSLFAGDDSLLAA